MELVADSRPRAKGGRHNDKTARITNAELRIPWPGWIFKSVGLSKREVIEVSLGKEKAFLSPKPDWVCIDGEPHESTGPTATPGIVGGGDKLAKRQRFLPAIGFHDLKYRPGEHTTAIRCSPHAGLDEFLVPWNNRLVSWGHAW